MTQSKISTNERRIIHPPESSKSCSWPPQIKPAKKSSKFPCVAEKEKAQPLRRKKGSLSPRPAKTSTTSSPKPMKHIEDTPDIGSVLLAFFGDPSAPPPSPKPTQYEWTRVENKLSRGKAPVSQQSRLDHQNHPSTEHKNWSEWSAKTVASTKADKNKKWTQPLLRKKSSEPPCALNISQPIPLGPIETGRVAYPEGWYPTRGFDVSIDQNGVAVPREANVESTPSATMKGDDLNRPNAQLLELSRPQATSGPIYTDKPLPLFPSLTVEFPGLTLTNKVLPSATSPKLPLPPFTFPAKPSVPSPAPSTQPICSLPPSLAKPKPQNPWTSKNWIFRDRLVFLSANGTVSFDFLEVSPKKPARTTTVYCSQSGDPEMVVPFNEDVGPFRRAALWDFVARSFGKGELIRKEKQRGRQRRRLLGCVKEVRGMQGGGNGAGLSALGTEVRNEEEEEESDTDVENSAVYEEWRKLLNGEGEW